MRMRFARLTVLAALIVPLGMMGVFAASASAEPGPECTGNSAKMKLSPGLSETAQMQTITIKGKLSGCTGGATSAKYTATETTNAVTCAAAKKTVVIGLPGSVNIAWKKVGTSTGTIEMPVSGLPEAGFSGMIESGAFAGSKIAGTFTETFKGTCGGKKPIKDVDASETSSSSSY